MKVIVKEEDSFVRPKETGGYEVIVDPDRVDAIYSRHLKSYGAIRPGRYHFIDQLTVNTHLDTGKLYLQARAAAILHLDNQYYGVVDVVNVSTLVSMYARATIGRQVQGSWLYQNYPHAEKIERKREYVKDFIMNFPVEVTKERSLHAVDWRFITKSEFLAFHADLRLTIPFVKYLEDAEFERIRDENELLR